MENKALAAIRKYNMLSIGDSVVVGLSGGADSCALLHFLTTLREDMKLQLYACHVNHMLRDGEADRDENFSRELCEKYDVPFFCLHIDVKSLALQHHESTETAGRNVRYSFFNETAERFGAKIATAHTASDQAETVLLNMTRGCGIKGLCGIPPVRGRIIRPLIEATRKDVELYCKENKLTFVTDSTNLENVYTRNRIRHDVIPALQLINPSFEDTVLRMSETMKSTQLLLHELALKATDEAAVTGGYDAAKLRTLHDAVFSELVFILCCDLNITPEARHIELIRGILVSGGAVQLRENIYAVCKQGIFRIIRKTETTDFSVPFSENISVYAGDRLLSVRKTETISDIPKCCLINADAVPDSAVFRYRKSGDKFCLPKRNVTKLLKKLFNELKIPEERRNSLIVLADGDNILWIEGIGAAQSCLFTENTDIILFLTVD